MKQQAGYISLPILFFLLMLMVVVLGASAYFFYLRLPLDQLHNNTTESTGLVAVKAAVVKALNADPTPDIDSPDDPIFSLDGTTISGYKIAVADVSSKLGLNWINLNIVEKTDLLKLLKPGMSIQQLTDHREEVGYGYDLAARYADYFADTSLQDFFTPWAWANINVSSEETLSDLYQFRTGPTGSVADFKAKVRDKFISLGLWKDSELPQVLGLGMDQVYPSINVLPCMNINFAPPRLIQAVLNYPFPSGIIENASAIAQGLINLRASKAISKEDLTAVIPIKNPQQERVFCYLGTRTWFWKITLTSETAKRYMIFAVAPEPGLPASQKNPKGVISLIKIGSETAAPDKDNSTAQP